jgi:ATP phosphoribosyltransferase
MASARNFPIEVYFLRNSDIPKYINDGVVDLAIIGENLLIEKDFEIDVIENLGFSKCKVSIAVPKEVEFNSISYLNNLKIATSYPNTLKKFLNKNNISADIHVINGSVEIAPNIGLSDAICDIVSSGSTLYKNNLKEVFVIHESQAVLAGNKYLLKSNKYLLDKFLFRVRAVLKAKESKYILLNAPNDKINAISEILPVLKSPTVLPLNKEGWSSLHSVINEDAFWEVIDKIKSAGAEDILVCPIEKMVL